MKRGEIWWLKEARRNRPALVLTRDSAIPLLSRVVIVPATTRIRGIPTEVSLTRNDGVPEDCVLASDNIRVVPKAWLRNRITSLSAARLDEVCEALRYALGC